MCIFLFSYYGTLDIRLWPPKLPIQSFRYYLRIFTAFYVDIVVSSIRLLVVLLPCPAIVELLHYIYLNFKLVKLYFHLFMQTLLVMESARANIFTAATKPYLFTLKYRQKSEIPSLYFRLFKEILIRKIIIWSFIKKIKSSFDC